jgi:four helix bundle protein
MAVIRSFKDLEVWRESHHLVMMVYRNTERYPRQERFGLVPQFRRAAVSIPANIAEKYGRRTTKELLQSLNVANGSLEEVRYFAFLGAELKYSKPGDRDAIERQCGTVARLLAGLARSLRSKMKKSKAPVTGNRSPVTRG